ncbi:MAG: hypothetical protein ACOCT9_01570 [archaeon]
MKTIKLPARKKELLLKETKPKEALLKPLPVEKILKIIQNCFQKKGLSKKSPASTHDIEYAVKKVIPFFKDFLKFRDWRYVLTWYHNWNPVGEITIEVLAEKINTETKLSLCKGCLNNEDLIFNDPGPVEDEWGMECPRAEFVMNVLYDFFSNANVSIWDWNENCTIDYPIINERPPFEEIYDELYENFFEHAVKYEWEHYKKTEYYNDFSDFTDNHEFTPGELFEFHPFELVFEFGENPGYFFMLEIYELGAGRHLGYILVEGYVAIEGLGTRLFVFEETIDKSDVFFTLDDAKKFYGNMIDDIYRSIVQWNKVMTEG